MHCVGILKDKIRLNGGHKWVCKCHVSDITHVFTSKVAHVTNQSLVKCLTVIDGLSVQVNINTTVHHGGQKINASSPPLWIVDYLCRLCRLVPAYQVRKEGLGPMTDDCKMFVWATRQTPSFPPSSSVAVATGEQVWDSLLQAPAEVAKFQGSRVAEGMPVTPLYTQHMVLGKIGLCIKESWLHCFHLYKITERHREKWDQGWGRTIGSVLKKAVTFCRLEHVR